MWVRQGQNAKLERRASDGARRGWGRWLVSASAVLLIAGCTTMEEVGDVVTDATVSAVEAANPLNWFDGDGDKKQPAAAEAKGAEAKGNAKSGGDGENKSFPKLGSVPNKPKTTTPVEREIIEEGLLADRENARHEEGPPPRLYAKPAPPGPKVKRGRVVRQATLPPAKAANGTAAKGTASTGESRAATAASGDVKVATIPFAAHSARLPRGTQRVLEQVAALHGQEGGTVRVTGHTTTDRLAKDPTKDQQGKYDLSAARARAVADVLTRLGVDRQKVSVEAKADTVPLARSNGGAENSRVDIFLVMPKK